MNRAMNWLPGLAGGQALPGYPASLRVIDGELDNRLARFIAVVPDAENPFPRARSGEVGLLEGWGLAKAVSEAVEADRHGQKRAIVAVIDVPVRPMAAVRKPWGFIRRWPLRCKPMPKHGWPGTR